MTAKPLTIAEHSLSGVTLVEASAGSGKTYSLTRLLLHLLVKKHVLIKEVLVVTFTNAATQELRERIERALDDALEAVAAANPPDDLAALCREVGAETARERLAKARFDLEDAPIFTIHGFCQRVLQDYPLEAGVGLDLRLEPDLGPLLREIAEDFWRRRMYVGNKRKIRTLLEQLKTPEAALKSLRSVLERPGARILPEFPPHDFEALEQSYEEAYRVAQGAFGGALEEIEARRSCFGKSVVGKIDRYRERLREFFAAETPQRIPGEEIKTFTRHFLEGENGPVRGRILSKYTWENDVRTEFLEFNTRFWDQHEALCRALDEERVRFQHDLLRTLTEDAEERKRALNVFGFSDILVSLKDALEKDEDGRLTGLLRKQYKAALVDEFQDTDPIQYAIFHRLFGDHGALFLIGDPKQAIYGFRGADIFTYMDVASSGEVGQATLTENWRSEAGMVKAVNDIFQRADAPFLYEQIPFRPATKATGSAPGRLLDEGGESANLQLWHLNASEGRGQGMNKAQWQRLVRRNVAAEVHRLLGDGVAEFLAKGPPAAEGGSPPRIQPEDGSPPRRVQPQDIAILVLRNSEARQMQEELRQWGIPSLRSVAESVLQSPEATEIYRLLCALLEPRDERLARGALLTGLFGRSGEEALLSEDTTRDQALDTLFSLRKTWERQGFMAMYRRLLDSQRVRQRLLRRPDGERRITNLLHAGELLHEQETAGNLGMSGLCHWLARQMGDNADSDNDQRLIRLESDERAVRIITVHKSKGLEYPIVFLPFMCNTGPKDATLMESGILFHDPAHGNQITLDLGSAEQEANLRHYRREELAEDVRKLYVALTRSVHRCYMVSVRSGKDFAATAPVYLLHHGDSGGDANAVAQRYAALDGAQVIEELALFADQSDGAISLRLLEATPEIQALAPSALSDEAPIQAPTPPEQGLPQGWRATSFSALARPESMGEIAAKRHERVLSAPAPVRRDPENFSDIMAFPQGIKAGLCLHEIFERTFCPRPDALDEVIAEALRSHGIDSQWQAAVAALAERVRAKPLEAAGFALGEVEGERLLPEVEFAYRLASPQMADLGVDKAWAAGLSRLPDGEGLLRGAIDLLFEHQGRYYVLDWKSNYLGPSPDDYRPEALAAAMDEAAYGLQARLYLVAAHRYLQRRLPEYDPGKHLGGAIYLFVRGIEDEIGSENGICWVRPGPEALVALSEAMG